MRFALAAIVILGAALFLHDVPANAADVTNWVRKDPRAPMGFSTEDPYLDRVKDMTRDQLTARHEAGELDATIQLAKLLWYSGDTDTPVALLRKPADMGIPAAQYLLGSYLRFKNRDMPATLDLWTKAAESGHALAQEALAGAFSIGTFGVVDEARAFDLYSRAAKQGLKHAQLSVGLMLCAGKGTPQNKADGSKWVTLAQRDQKVRVSLREAGCT